MTSLHRLPGFLIRRLHQISTSIFAERMARLGEDITGVQFSCLSVLRDCPGLDQATLAAMTAQDRVTIGGAVDRLVTKGLVKREISPRDRRARVLTLSPEGEAVHARLSPEITACQAEILAGLDPAETAQFLRLLTQAVQFGNDRSRAPLHLPPVRPADPSPDQSPSDEPVPT